LFISGKKFPKTTADHLPCSPLFPSSFKWRSITFTLINCAERSSLFWFAEKNSRQTPTGKTHRRERTVSSCLFFVFKFN
jgi:hypothetical protein